LQTHTLRHHMLGQAHFRRSITLLVLLVEFDDFVNTNYQTGVVCALHFLANAGNGSGYVIFFFASLSSMPQETRRRCLNESMMGDAICENS
jgi:hypothetical protein